jgi:hypothetical protein
MMKCACMNAPQMSDEECLCCYDTVMMVCYSLFFILFFLQNPKLMTEHNNLLQPLVVIRSNVWRFTNTLNTKVGIRVKILAKKPKNLATNLFINFIDIWRVVCFWIYMWSICAWTFIIPTWMTDVHGQTLYQVNCKWYVLPGLFTKYFITLCQNFNM